MDILMFSLPNQVVVVHKPKQSTVAREKVNILLLTNIKLQHKEKCFELIKVLQMLFLMPQTVKVQKKGLIQEEGNVSYFKAFTAEEQS